jgi:formylglycine-generating enzyme required for sulfatase activity
MSRTTIITIYLTLVILTVSCTKDMGPGNPVNVWVELKAPVHLMINSNSGSEVWLSWEDSSSNETGYEIEQSTDGKNYSLVQTAKANISTATITGTFDFAITYYFRVRAKSQYYRSPYSNVQSFNRAKEAGMIFVEGGTFTMGSPNGIGFSEEQPEHSVTLSDYYIGMYEVTQKRWREVVRWKQANGGTLLSENPSYFTGDSLPVERISWNIIQTWLGYLNECDGLTNSPNQYRLPTEAEWEYAARGGKNWRDQYIYSGSNTIDGVSWYTTNSGSKTHIVGTKAKNQLDIYDMNGNVWEWCSDYYSSVYYQQCFDLGTISNPIGPTSGIASRVVRGGSFNDDNDCRIALRSYANPDVRNLYTGFRIARNK